LASVLRRSTITNMKSKLITEHSGLEAKMKREFELIYLRCTTGGERVSTRREALLLVGGLAENWEVAQEIVFLNVTHRLMSCLLCLVLVFGFLEIIQIII